MPGPPGPPLVHLKVYVSGVIHTSVQLLWDLIRDYGQAHTWFGTYRGVKTFTSLLVSLQLTRIRVLCYQVNPKMLHCSRVWVPL